MRTWPNVATIENGYRRSLAQQTAWADQLLRAAIVMAMYLNGEEKPIYLQKEIDYVRKTFGVELSGW